MKEKQTLASKGLAFGPSVFCDDGEDAMYTTFPDGRTVKYVPERTCQMSNEDWDDSFGAEYKHLYECGICSESTALLCCINENGDTDWVKPKFCGHCGAKAVES